MSTPYDLPSDPAKRQSAALTDGPDRAGARAMRKATGFTDEDLAKQIDTVEIETLNYRRGQISAELQQQQTAAGQSTGGSVFVSPEHNVWPFNGEYWRDELGFYRQVVTSKCAK